MRTLVVCAPNVGDTAIRGHDHDGRRVSLRRVLSQLYPLCFSAACFFFQDLSDQPHATVNHFMPLTQSGNKPFPDYVMCTSVFPEQTS